jgi:hypothetical protein
MLRIAFSGLFSRIGLELPRSLLAAGNASFLTSAPRLARLKAALDT